MPGSQTITPCTRKHTDTHTHTHTHTHTVFLYLSIYLTCFPTLTHTHLAETLSPFLTFPNIQTHHLSFNPNSHKGPLNSPNPNPNPNPPPPQVRSILNWRVTVYTKNYGSLCYGRSHLKQARFKDSELRGRGMGAEEVN